MRLSKINYYLDFVVYPIAIAVLAAVSLEWGNWWLDAQWFGACVAGAGAWTLLEYWLHRIALHKIRYFVPMHALHHRKPLDFVGTPTWLSLSVLTGAIFLPAWRIVGFTIASGLTAGVMIGYLWYGLIHHGIHHYRGRSMPPYLERSRVRHLRHHYSPRRGNFGVTTSLWDHAFGTAIEP